MYRADPNSQFVTSFLGIYRAVLTKSGASDKNNFDVILIFFFAYLLIFVFQSTNIVVDDLFIFILYFSTLFGEGQEKRVPLSPPYMRMEWPDKT